MPLASMRRSEPATLIVFSSVAAASPPLAPIVNCVEASVPIRSSPARSPSNSAGRNSPYPAPLRPKVTTVPSSSVVLSRMLRRLPKVPKR